MSKICEDDNGTLNNNSINNGWNESRQKLLSDKEAEHAKKNIANDEAGVKPVDELKFINNIIAYNEKYYDKYNIDLYMLYGVDVCPEEKVLYYERQKEFKEIMELC